MAVTVWRGHLTFGLISIPVRLFRAARSDRIRFRQVYRGARKEPFRRLPADEAEPAPARPIELTEPPVYRVRHAAVTEAEDIPVPSSEVTRGYEYEKDKYVLVDDAEIKRETFKTSTDMSLLEFVRLDEIDPVYFETSYYVRPEESGAKAYALLFSAMRKTGYAGLAEIAMHGREHIVIVRPGKHGLLAHTMYFQNEIRADEEFRSDTELVRSKEMDLAVLFIESLTAPFQPEKYKDKFRERVQALIEGKLEQGRSAERRVESAPAPDILEALRRSLALARKPVASQGGQPKRRASGK